MKIVLLSIVSMSVLLCNAQTGTPRDSSGLETNDFYMDFANPNVAASYLLNLDPTSISKPGSVKEFFVGIGNFVDLQGNIKPNLSLEWAPLMTFLPQRSYSRSTYNWFNLLNITLSLASAEDSLNTRTAGAFKWVVIDRTNPLLSKNGRVAVNKLIEEKQILVHVESTNSQRLIEELDDAFNTICLSLNAENCEKFEEALKVKNSDYQKKLAITINSSSTNTENRTKLDKILTALSDSVDKSFPGGVPNVSQDKLEEIYKKAAAVFLAETNLREKMNSEFKTDLTKFKEKFKDENWNKLTVEVGFGGILNSSEGTIQTMSNHYQTGYISTAFCPFSKTKGTKRFGRYLQGHSQLIGLAKYTNYTTQDSTQNNSFFTGTRLLIGDYDKRFSAEIGYINNHNRISGLNESGVKYSIGAEFRLSDGNWLEFAIGGESFNGSTRINLLPKVAFSHSFNSEGRFFKK